MTRVRNGILIAELPAPGVEAGPLHWKRRWPEMQPDAGVFGRLQEAGFDLSRPLLLVWDRGAAKLCAAQRWPPPRELEREWDDALEMLEAQLALTF